MKKQLLLSLILMLLCGIIYGQHLIRVNNNLAADADYTTIQAANDNAVAGDTIYVEGSTTNYNDAITFDKRLTIIGPGYFLTENDSTQANGLEAYITGYMTFGAGSENSNITGIKFSALIIDVSNITVSRCNGSSISLSNDLPTPIENIFITQNYLNNIQQGGSYSYSIKNSIISNNIIYSNISTYSSSGPFQILNNIILASGFAPISVYNSTISNNITCSTTNKISVNTGNTITNNISAAAGTNENGNKYSVAMTSVFVDFSGSLSYSDDAKWKLKTVSPATGAGVGGVDCGVFGGPTPYVLSGIPALPHIYEAAIPGVGYSGSGLSCTIKIKAGK